MKETAYKDEIVWFKEQLADIGQSQGWTLDDLQERFSNKLWDEIIYSCLQLRSHKGILHVMYGEGFGVCFAEHCQFSLLYACTSWTYSRTLSTNSTSTFKTEYLT